MTAQSLQIRVLTAIILALAVGAVFITVDGSNPLEAYKVLFTESFFDYWGLSNTLVDMSPMLLAGLAVILPLRAGLFNIGGEGQIYMGGLFGALFALALPDLPGWIGIPMIFVCAAIGGGLWAAIPAYLRAYRDINEVIVTLLMNFIAIHIVSYAVAGPLLAESAPYPYSEEVSSQYRLPIMLARTDAHMGFLIGIVCAVLLYFWLRSTPSGFKLDLVGRNRQAAKYAGVNTKRQIMIAMIVGGMFAGLAGAIEVIGLKYRLFHLFSDGYGYQGIIVAFLATLNPLLAPLSAFFLAGLSAGAGTMQRAVGVEGSIIEVIEGLVVLFVAAAIVPKAIGGKEGIGAFLKMLLGRKKRQKSWNFF
ncbi:ABC transporter permease [Roseibium sp. SCP14]|uniref:ABC transporter permease n=1 Tax=Roseibium sp. SCP14 TaxID=3141375 RepID=UPI0033380CEE